MKTLEPPTLQSLHNWSARRYGPWPGRGNRTQRRDERAQLPGRFPLSRGNASIARLLTTVHLYRVPVSGERSGIEQFRAGRYELLGTPFATFEQKIREQLGAMLAEGGFDPARDIKGISVNRWPHGYAVGYDYQSGELNWFGNTWPEDHKLWLRGRQRSRDMSKVELNALNGRLGQLVFDDDQFLAGTSKIESQTSRT